MLFSCVDPIDIPLGGNSDWVVFGYLGEGKPPVIFVYGVSLARNQLIYNYDAKISVTDETTQQTYELRVAINEDLNKIYPSEYPFGEDALGNLVYYTSNEFVPIEGRSYQIDFDLSEEEKGVSNVEIPASINFSEVEMVTNNSGVTRLLMSINDAPEKNYYKWEVKIDQNIAIPVLEVDSLSGDSSTLFTDQQFFVEFMPNNFISEEQIEENDNIFRLNLSASLIDFENVEENYELNVRLRHYGKEVVEYFESIREQNTGSLYDPFIEPIFIKSNIDGVIGLIGTYSYSESTLLEYQP